MPDQETQTTPAVQDVEKLVRQATIAGFVFTAIYALVGIWQISDDKDVLGAYCLIVATMFFLGSLVVLKGGRKEGRVFLLIGGFMGIPLGLVMVGFANRMNAALKAAEPVQSDQDVVSLQLK